MLVDLKSSTLQPFSTPLPNVIPKTSLFSLSYSPPSLPQSPPFFFPFFLPSFLPLQRYHLLTVPCSQTFVRCERQTLHRLPKSLAVVFAFRTYLYPIQEIKDEGLGPDLADAIDGLQKGNAPGMHFYKRGVVWGEAVKKYLRS